MSTETIARRYATALADVVVKTGEGENVTAELKQWDQLIAGNEDLSTAFGNPAIVHLNKERLLESLIEKTRPSRTTANFLRVLLRNDRLGELNEIIERFEKEVRERQGIITAEVTSARDLPAEERSELKASLERLTGKAVNLNFQTDAELIGGVVTRIGSTVYDGSVRTKLENLREELING